MKFIYSILLFSSLLFFVSCSDNDNSSNDLSHSKISTLRNTADLPQVNVSIIRDKITKNAIFIIDETTQSWKLYTGNSISTIDRSKSILDGTGSGTYSLDVSNSTRSYFELVYSDGSSTYFAEKHLPMTGGYNFRDLGGTKTIDGKTLQWGKLFRADEFKNLTDNDLLYLSSIPLITDVDFRSKSEIAAAPHKLPNLLKNYIELSITSGSLNLDLSKITLAEADSFMLKLNLELVTDSLAISQYRKFFVLVQNEEYLPLIYNCSAGKDRTGMATALILYALNVDEEIIFEDYLSSNTYLQDKYAPTIAKYPYLKPIFEVRREFLQTGIDKIKENYGTVQNYLVTVLDVDLNKMREIYSD